MAFLQAFKFKTLKLFAVHRAWVWPSGLGPAASGMNDWEGARSHIP